MKSRSTSYGFSLVELLVVIAVIAVLAAALFPVMTAAKERAKRSSCESNLKQLIIGTMLYVDDYHRYPSQPQDGINNWKDPTAKPNWARSVERYVKGSRIDRCPNALKASVCRSGCPMRLDSVSYPISYFGNGRIFKDALADGSVLRATRTIVFQCCGQAWNMCWMAPTWNDEYGSWESYVDKSWCCHNSGTELAFADGHVAWMNYVALSGNLSLFDPSK